MTVGEGGGEGGCIVGSCTSVTDIRKDVTIGFNRPIFSLLLSLLVLLYIPIYNVTVLPTVRYGMVVQIIIRWLVEGNNTLVNNK